jgi:hypothetical protein
MPRQIATVNMEFHMTTSVDKRHTSYDSAGSASFGDKTGSRKFLSAGKRSRAGLAGLLVAPVLLAGSAMAADSPFAEQVKAANARFVDVAVAKAEGYTPIPCASGTDGGSMGIHYVNMKLLGDDALDVAHPEAVLYEPDATGKLNLIAVEYITEKGPAAALGEQLFSFTNSPNRYGLPPFYEIHVWAWKANPMGTFADMNPNVSCDAAPMGGM